MSGFYDEKNDLGPKSNGSQLSLEKGLNVDVVDARDEDRYQFDVADLDQVQRRLKQRHVQMIAIAGTIGTGLFLGSGGALRGAGPLGALLAYAFVGTIAYASLCSIGEMTTHAPVSGNYPHFASRWVDPALGFAVGWNCFYSAAISVPGEITAASILMTFWDKNKNHAGVYIAVILVVVCTINVFGVRWFGETEFLFAIIKICLITGLIIVGLVIDLGGVKGQERLGFRYWKEPGPLARANLVHNLGTDRFLGIMSVLIQAAYSFQGMELVAIAASETESPRRNIAKAVRRVFFRILVFYLLGIFVVGVLVPYNDNSLLHGTGTAKSPYVIAMYRAGIKVLPHIVNAGVLTSALSAANSYIFCSSRILYGLALRKQAPRIFTYCTKEGLPLTAILVTAVISLLAFMNISSSSAAAFKWFTSLTTTAGFCNWMTINLTYIFFYRGLKAQGIDRTKNVYCNPLQPYLAYWGLFWTAFLVLISGFEVFFHFKFVDFVTAYVNVPAFIAVYFGWKFYKKTKIWKPEEMDFVTGIPTVEETEIPEVPPVGFWQKVAAILF